MALLFTRKCRRLHLDLRRIRPDDYASVIRVVRACIDDEAGEGPANLESLVIKGGTVYSDCLVVEVEALCKKLAKCSHKLKVNKIINELMKS